MRLLYGMIYATFSGIVFYFRGSIFGEESRSLSGLLPVLLGGLVALQVMGFSAFMKSLRQLPRPALLLWAAVFLNTFLNGILSSGSYQDAVVLFAEFSLNMLVFVVVFTTLRRGMVSVQGHLAIMQWCGALATLWVLSRLLQMDFVRRVVVDGTAVNHIAHSLAMMVMIAIIRLTGKEGGNARPTHLAINLSLVLSGFSSLFVTGTRSAMLGLSAAFVLCFWNRNFGIKSLFFSMILLASFYMLLSNHGERFDMLKDRYSGDLLEVGADSRFELWAEALAEMYPEQVLIGNPNSSELVSENNWNPHNLWISLVRYYGILPLICFIWLLCAAIRRILAQAEGCSRILPAEAFAVLVCLVISLVYSTLSGSVTRIITPFYLLGLATGMGSVAERGRQESPKEMRR
jgi:hypothetical protein